MKPFTSHVREPSSFCFLFFCSIVNRGRDHLLQCDAIFLKTLYSFCQFFVITLSASFEYLCRHRQCSLHICLSFTTKFAISHIPFLLASSFASQKLKVIIFTLYSFSCTSQQAPNYHYKDSPVQKPAKRD